MAHIYPLSPEHRVFPSFFWRSTTSNIEELRAVQVPIPVYNVTPNKIRCRGSWADQHPWRSYAEPLWSDENGICGEPYLSSGLSLRWHSWRMACPGDGMKTAGLLGDFKCGSTELLAHLARPEHGLKPFHLCISTKLPWAANPGSIPVE